ncbi:MULTISPECIES: WD40 repeat domain-containing protein [Leptolyngbya]|uniref:WD40 repeat domain-containing protein n=1 Tax=Leptolyngbya TaxID=47251 RepID=UPI001688F5BA|nr:WD40 repeat domain-containing protein [Leptolyngbya sp. FACHB-1624]
MTQNRWVQKLSIAGVALIAFLAAMFLLLWQATSSRGVAKVCMPIYAADVMCYGQRQLMTSHKPTTITVSPLGGILAAGYEREIELWDLKTGKALPRLQDHTDLVSAIAISPDEKILASSSLDGTIKLWDLPHHRLVSTLNAGRASNLAFSPDGRMLASSSGVHRWADGVFSPLGVQMWDIASRQRVYGLGTQPVRAIAFSPDGHLLAAGDRMKTELWQVRDGERLQTLNSGEVTGLVFCQDGQTLITGSSKLKLWDLRNGKLLHEFDAGASDMVLSPDGQTLATSSGGSVHLWHLFTEQSLGSLYATSFSSLFVEFALKGQAIVAAGTDGIWLWRDLHSETATP